MDVILVRHAEAGSRDPNTWPDDDQRPITADGRRKQVAAARAMRKMGIEFGFLVTSPLLRARQTAEILAAVYNWDEEAQLSDALGSNCTPANVLKLLAKFPPDTAVCLVGHEPAFSKVAAAFISKSGDARIEVKKSGVIGISFEGAAGLGMGTLLYHLKPGQLRKLKG